MTNAIKFTSKNGTVQIVVEVHCLGVKDQQTFDSI